MNTLNGLVACTPFPTTDLKIHAKGGLPVLQQKQELSKLTVVFDSWDKERFGPEYKAGGIVYLRGDSCKHLFAREVFELGGQMVILVPASMIVAYEEPRR